MFSPRKKEKDDYNAYAIACNNLRMLGLNAELIRSTLKQTNATQSEKVDRTISAINTLNTTLQSVPAIQKSWQTALVSPGLSKNACDKAADLCATMGDKNIGLIYEFFRDPSQNEKIQKTYKQLAEIIKDLDTYDNFKDHKKGMIEDWVPSTGLHRQSK